MAKTLDLNLIVNHIVNGTFGENLCRVCLLPLSDKYENIFTKICKLNEEYCIADVLKEICDVQFSDNDHYNVCSDCFVRATNAYKFYLNSKRCEELLQFYINQMQYNLDMIDSSDNTDIMNTSALYITLPAEIPDIPQIEVNAEKVCVKKDNENIELPHTEKVIDKLKENVSQKVIKKETEDEDDIVIIFDDKHKPSFFKMDLVTNNLVEVEFNDRCRIAYKKITEAKLTRKRHKKREPMTWKKCSRCPVQYRFIAKLKKHMLLDHHVTLYSCKICEALTEDMNDFISHISMHTNEYECDLCNCVFKKRESMIHHLSFHNESDFKINSDLVCKDCGSVFTEESSYKQHIEIHNQKDYTCYYCGRMYKNENGFNNHIRKHEMYMKLKEVKPKHTDRHNSSDSDTKNVSGNTIKKDFTCELCGRNFLGHRALLWHSRLHTNERPFSCEECGRRFVSLNRRNQHALCAHTAPTRRCPLCPALFHMKSMVNTHIKKVHLKTHKRRSRAVRQQEVHWHTEPVPIQELSVDIQADILKLKNEDPHHCVFMEAE